MGLCAGQARVLMLTSQYIDLGTIVQGLCQTQMNTSGGIMQFATRESEINQRIITEGRTPELLSQLESINNGKAQLAFQDKNITNLKTQFENRHKMVETEMESAKKIVDKAIESGFKYFA